MSDPLDRVVDVQIDAYRPDTVPPFTVIEGRKRRRDRRRLAVAGTLLPAAALGLALVVVPQLDGGGLNERLSPGNDAPAPSVRVCAGAGDDAQCRTVTDPAAVRELGGAFRQGEQGDQRCPYYDQIIWRVVFTDPSGDSVVDVPAACGSTLTDPAYRVSGDERELVRQILAAEDVTGHAWTGAQICMSERLPDGGPCRTLNAEQAAGLDGVLRRARPAPDGTAYCEALGPTYSVTFQHPAAKPVPYKVPIRCGPVLKGGQPHLLDQPDRDAVARAFAAAAPGAEPAATPYPWSDCNALQPGDAFADVADLHCNAEEGIQVEFLDCVDGTYVHLERTGRDNLEGIEGKTPTWRAAEPLDPSHGRTPWAFKNCQEHG